MAKKAKKPKAKKPATKKPKARTPAAKKAKAKKPAPKKAKAKKPAAMTPELEALANAYSDPDDYDLDELNEAELSSAPIDRRERGLVKLSNQTVVTGDFVIDGDLELNGKLVVLGSLRCTGFVFTGIHGCLVVRGDLSARAVEAHRTYWMIGGSITADTAWLSTYGFLMLGGELVTKLLVVQMDFDLVDDPVIKATTRIDTAYLPDDADAKAKLAAVLDTSKLLTKDGEFDSWALLRASSRGEQVFLS